MPASRVAEAATGAEATHAARTSSGPAWCCWTSSCRTSTASRWPGGWPPTLPHGPAPVVVLTSTREARDYRRAAASPAGRLPVQGSALRRRTAPLPGRGPGMSRRLLAVLITGAIAAAGSLAWSGWPPSPDYVPILICYEVIGLSFLVAGIAAYARWPVSRLGLLFTIAGYLYLLPYILVNLANPVAFTLGKPDPGYLHRRRGPPGSGLAHRAAPVEVRVRRGHLRLRAGHRLQRSLDAVLESRLHRLHHRMPGQRAARRRCIPGPSGTPSTRQAASSALSPPRSC